MRAFARGQTPAFFRMRGMRHAREVISTSFRKVMHISTSLPLATALRGEGFVPDFSM